MKTVNALIYLFRKKGFCMIDYLKKIRNKWHSDIDNELTYLNNLMSFASNSMLIEQGVVEETTEYAYFKKIHELLEIRELDKQSFDFMRLGRDNDGGYIVVYDKNNNAISNNKIMYSLGISDDVSLDLEFAKRGYDVYQYDHTINRLPFQNDKFHWKKIGITGKKENADLKRLETLIKMDRNDCIDGMVLKCDIEGAEWDMFQGCSMDTLKKFDEIIVEFHGILNTRKRSKILSVLDKISNTHQTVHVHANNNSLVNYSGNLITPDVIEVTYVLKDKFATSPIMRILPISLDQPCNHNKIDIIPGKWNL